MIEEMMLGHYAVIWVANGVIPIGVFLIFFLDQLIQAIMGLKKNARKRRK